jgi:hypothetical protein
MKFRLKCPACNYKFIVHARYSSDTGEATCPAKGCNKVFEYRGPDAPMKTTKVEGQALFDQLFGGKTSGQKSIFDDLLKGRK